MALGSPSVQPITAQSGITSPTTGASVSGDVPVFGTAVIEPFQRYELYYKLEPSADDAYIYFHGDTRPVQNGQLGVWQTGQLQPGIYSLRLRVVKNDGNYAEYFAQNISVNQNPPSPSPTPTSSEPTPTPIPTATFTPAPQPTVQVGAVSQPELEMPTPTPTVEAVAIAEPDGTITGTAGTGAQTGVTTAAGANVEGNNVTRELGEALSLNRLRNHFLNGMRFSAALFLGVVTLYGSKRLFDWVWAQFT